MKVIKEELIAVTKRRADGADVTATAYTMFTRPVGLEIVKLMIANQIRKYIG
jgi:hypothetical protein